MDSPLSDDPYFLFISTSEVDGAADRLKTSGITYARKSLNSSPENWTSIAEILESDPVRAALVRINPTVCRRIVEDSYRESGSRIFAALQNMKHIVFAHESVVSGVETDNQWEGYTTERAIAEDNWDFFTYMEYFAPPPDDVRVEVVRIIEQYSLNLMVYRTNAELSVMSSSFIDDTEKQLLLRVYVPSDKLWADQAEKFIILFHDWLTKARGYRVRQSGYSTNLGSVYEFYGDADLASEGLSVAMNRFGEFLELCANDENQALEVLRQVEIVGEPARALIDRYSREARRLALDLRHERDNRVRSLIQRFESDLLETDIARADIQTAVESLVPQNPSTLTDSLSLPLSQALQGVSHLTINQNPQFFNNVSGYVAHEISGTANYGPEPLELLQLVKDHGGEDATDLESAVHEMEDSEAELTNRLMARQKLKTFLLKAGGKVGSVALQTLQKYVEAKLGI